MLKINKIKCEIFADGGSVSPKGQRKVKVDLNEPDRNNVTVDDLEIVDIKTETNN